MRVIVLGGTRFIGRALVHSLAEHGHDVMVAHRGEQEPTDFPDVEHLHVLRKDVASKREELSAFGADVVVDMIAGTRQSAQIALEAIEPGPRLVVISSIDVYRAYGGVLNDTVTDAVPVSEVDPVRTERYPYRGKMEGADEYEKLDVEEEYRARGGIVLRLPMVYGEHDGQRREEFILRRVRAGRKQIPIGSGVWLTSRGYVRDIGNGIRLAAESDGYAGEVFNLAERRSATTFQWAKMILEAAGSDAELVRVDEASLPEDMESTRSIPQHLLADAGKARALLGWHDGEHASNLRASVTWHLANPPTDASDDFMADDEALATV